MYNQTKIMSAIGALAFAWDMNVDRRHRKQIKKLQKRNAELAEMNARSCLQILYLMDLLEKNGVKATEFDLIAMKTLMNKD